jgi:hypothetical protein
MEGLHLYSYKEVIWEGKMRCQRCDGIMVSEEFYGLDDVFSGWRCIFCGEIIDPVILKNRRIQKPRAFPSQVQINQCEIPSVSDAPRPGMRECPPA